MVYVCERRNLISSHHARTHTHSASTEEQQKFQKKRAEELYVNIRNAKLVAKKRAEQMSKMIEVSRSHDL